MEEHARAGEGTGVAVNIMISKRDTCPGHRAEVRTEIVRLVNGHVHETQQDHILTSPTDAYNPHYLQAKMI